MADKDIKDSREAAPLASVMLEIELRLGCRLLAPRHGLHPGMGYTQLSVLKPHSIAFTCQTPDEKGCLLRHIFFPRASHSMGSNS